MGWNRVNSGKRPDFIANISEKLQPGCPEMTASRRYDLVGTFMENNAADFDEALRRGRAGDRKALDSLLDRYRDRLRRMVEMRLDTRLQARLDASDVVQDAYVEVAERLDEYLRDPKLPLFLWLRLVVGERLMKLHRHHLGTQMRDAGREVSLYRGTLPAASSAALAAQLLGKYTSPTQAVLRAERILRLQEALNALEPIDREILSLRHFEELTAGETARVLGIEESAAAKRYFRALKRLKDVLTAMPDGP
jgi:RNA polymerase sigma-70 factor (ECF subfamily)